MTENEEYIAAAARDAAYKSRALYILAAACDAQNKKENKMTKELDILAAARAAARVDYDAACVAANAANEAAEAAYGAAKAANAAAYSAANAASRDARDAVEAANDAACAAAEADYHAAYAAYEYARDVQNKMKTK